MPYGGDPCARKKAPTKSGREILSDAPLRLAVAAGAMAAGDVEAGPPHAVAAAASAKQHEIWAVLNRRLPERLTGETKRHLAW